MGWRCSHVHKHKLPNNHIMKKLKKNLQVPVTEKNEDKF